VKESPIEQLFAAIDSLDVEAVMALLAPEARLLVADGRRAEGTDEVRELVTSVLAELRSTTHEVTAQWHVEDAWIAEVDASYELRDFLRLGALPRALVLREGPDGIADLRFYGAHEHPVSEHPTGEEWGSLVRGRWIPPL
jgi:hypothetical protein